MLATVPIKENPIPQQNKDSEWDPNLGVWKNLNASSQYADSELPNPLWIFGYGSLCFNPGSMSGFESKHGYIKGFTRRFWQKSCDHRGTPQSPGLVCTILSDEEWKQYSDSFESRTVFGRVFKIPEENKKEILDELDFREKGGYSRVILDVYITNNQEEHAQNNEVIKAVLYTANSANPNFLEDNAIRQDVKKQAEIIQNSVGPSGRNIEYFLKLYRYLKEENQVDEYIDALAHPLKDEP